MKLASREHNHASRSNSMQSAAHPMNQWDSETITVASVLLPLPQEDQGRADLYALLAGLLLAPPDEALLAALASADSLDSQQMDNPLEQAWENMILAAGVMDAYAVQEEFDTLFVSIGTPQLNPYSSLYLAGFMMEKPLAALRAELASLGLGRAHGSNELEDHIGALCETMRVMITGGPGIARQPLWRQKAFFDKHIASWHERCFNDMRAASGANFYRHVADFAQAFLSVEAQAFEMEGHGHGN